MYRYESQIEIWDLISSFTVVECKFNDFGRLKIHDVRYNRVVSMKIIGIRDGIRHVCVFRSFRILFVGLIKYDLISRH